MILLSRQFLFLHPSHPPEQTPILRILSQLLPCFIQASVALLHLRFLPGYIEVNFLGWVYNKPGGLPPGVVTISTCAGTLSHPWGRFLYSPADPQKGEGESLLSLKEGQAFCPATPLSRAELVAGKKGQVRILLRGNDSQTQLPLHTYDSGSQSEGSRQDLLEARKGSLESR